MPETLGYENHDRDWAGMTYVYPVVSRRARGVSIGINLNPNNACNWRCVYCQVPELRFGKGPPIDLERLDRELATLLEAVLEGDFFESQVPEGLRRLNDVAFSGNGEPTSSPDFEAAIETVGARLATLGQAELKRVLITNGSLMHRESVQRGLARLGAGPGEVWYKLDRATPEGLTFLNGAPGAFEHQRRNLATAARLCPTWLQTLMLAVDGEPPSEAECAAYLAVLEATLAEGVPLRGVLLYGLARPSHQPEAARLSALPTEWLEALGERIAALGLAVSVHA